jgi:hypothetical protein
MALGGWKSGRMMRRCAVVTDQTLRAAAEAVSGHEPVPTRRSGATAGVVHKASSRPHSTLRRGAVDTMRGQG